jgi:uncharacterized protein (TIRG00374 family)
MRKYFSLAILILIIVFVGFYLNKNLSIIMETFSTTAANLTGYFFLAAIFVFLAYFFIAKSYQVVFAMNGLKRNAWELNKLNIIGLAVNVIIPTAGLSQAVIYAEDAHKRGESKSVTVNSVLATYISDYTSITLFVLVSLAYLYAIDSVVPHVVIPAVVLVVLTTVVYVLSYFAGKESQNLEKFIVFLAIKIEGVLKFIFRKRFNIHDSIDSLYKNFKNMNKAIIADPKDWIKAIGWASLYHAFAIASIYVILVSLGYQPLVRVIIAAYSVGEAIRIVSPTPSGIGFVEGAMYLVFTSLGVPGPVATTTAIIFRGLVFWIPLGIGTILYQRRKLKEAFSEIVSGD